MTPEQIEYRYLSLRAWVMSAVWPASMMLLIALLFSMTISEEKLRDQTAVLVGFAALYYCLLRGGHIIMVRSLHRDMLAKYEADYREKLSGLSPKTIGRTISFTLTRIKREILNKEK